MSYNVDVATFTSPEEYKHERRKDSTEHNEWMSKIEPASDNTNGVGVWSNETWDSCSPQQQDGPTTIDLDRRKHSHGVMGWKGLSEEDIIDSMQVMFVATPSLTHVSTSCANPAHPTKTLNPKANTIPWL